MSGDVDGDASGGAPGAGVRLEMESKSCEGFSSQIRV